MKNDTIQKTKRMYRFLWITWLVQFVIIAFTFWLYNIIRLPFSLLLIQVILFFITAISIIYYRFKISLYRENFIHIFGFKK